MFEGPFRYATQVPSAWDASEFGDARLSPAEVGSAPQMAGVAGAGVAGAGVAGAGFRVGDLAAIAHLLTRGLPGHAQVAPGHAAGVRQGEVRQGEVRRGETRQGETRQGEARPKRARRKRGG